MEPEQYSLLTLTTKHMTELTRDDYIVDYALGGKLK